MKKNSPDLWRTKLPKIAPDGHKYNRGHALIYGAPDLTGATRLAAEACARIGAGLVTVLANSKTADIYRETLRPHILVRDDLGWMDDRVTARLYGSGGLATEPDYESGLPTVLDADALQKLPEKLGGNYVLTPHEGEFKRAFPDLAHAEEAAKKIGAIIVLKGPETVIAHPDGSVVTNAHATPHLATAGTGDVLAGMITGLMAQGMAPFDAACAGVWMHGEAGIRIGHGLVASDLAGQIPAILQDFS